MKWDNMCSVSQMMKIIFAFTVFFLGFVYIIQTPSSKAIEGFETAENDEVDVSGLNAKKYNSIGGEKKCPNVLIQKNNLLYLYDTTQPEIPGVNPTVFHNLEDYVEYMKYLRSKGIRCPVLHLQHIEDIQGGNGYRIFPSPEDLNAGLPLLHGTIVRERNLIDAHHDPKSMPGYDPSGFDLGVVTPLDKMYHSRERISDNAMDPHWGGVAYSRSVIDTGKYKDNTRTPMNTNHNTIQTHTTGDKNMNTLIRNKKANMARLLALGNKTEDTGLRSSYTYTSPNTSTNTDTNTLPTSTIS